MTNCAGRCIDMIYAYKTNAMFLCFFNCQIDCVINDNHGVIFMTIHKSR